MIFYQFLTTIIAYYIFAKIIVLLLLTYFTGTNYFQTATAAFSTTEMAPGENVIVPLIARSLEFTLSAPPPIHQFVESPIVVETDHLTLYPGKEAEEVLKMQGHEVTDIVGKEKWLQNDPEKYEGLIPQNVEWTEFIDEKNGEWVYLNEYGDRVEKPVS
jgi:heme/copper-type cytochrome/quinol oxidase subunit 1